MDLKQEEIMLNRYLITNVRETILAMIDYEVVGLLSKEIADDLKRKLLRREFFYNDSFQLEDTFEKLRKLKPIFY